MKSVSRRKLKMNRMCFLIWAMIFALVDYSNSAAISKQTSSKTMYEAILEKCPQHNSSLFSMRNDKPFTACQNWTHISSKIQLNRIEKMCLLYYHSFTEYCSSTVTLDITNVPVLNFNVAEVCGYLENITYFKNLFNATMTCSNLCSDDMGYVNRICQLSFYYGSALKKTKDKTVDIVPKIQAVNVDIKKNTTVRPKITNLKKFSQPEVMPNISGNAEIEPKRPDNEIKEATLQRNDHSKENTHAQEIPIKSKAESNEPKKPEVLLPSSAKDEDIDFKELQKPETLPSPANDENIKLKISTANTVKEIIKEEVMKPVIEKNEEESEDMEDDNLKPLIGSDQEPMNEKSEVDGDSYFFTYFMILCIIFVAGYVCYHNKQKVLALILEGRRDKRQYRSRRPNSANYHKLDSNLEEAITSSCNKNPTHVIY